MEHCLWCVCSIFSPSLRPSPSREEEDICVQSQDFLAACLQVAVLAACLRPPRPSQAWERENKGVLPSTRCSSSSTFPLDPISSSSQLPLRTGEGLVSSLWRKLEPSPGSWQHRGGGTPKSQPTLERSAYPTINLHLLELAYLLEGQEPQLNTIVALWDASAKKLAEWTKN